MASNTSINANAGVYLRPYHDEYRQLQAGLSMSYMDYSKNLSYFTYGQGLLQPAKLRERFAAG